MDNERKTTKLAGGVVDDLHEGCQVIDDEFRYRYVNDAVVEHARRTRESMLGQTMASCFPGIEHTEMFGVLQRCMAREAPAQMENRFTYPDGKVGWFELRFSPTRWGGRPAVAILSVDVTARKRDEEGLRAANRVLRAVSACKQALLTAADEHAYAHQVCGLVVQAGYVFARVEVAGELGSEARDAPSGPTEFGGLAMQPGIDVRVQAPHELLDASAGTLDHGRP